MKNWTKRSCDWVRGRSGYHSRPAREPQRRTEGERAPGRAVEAVREPGQGEAGRALRREGDGWAAAHQVGEQEPAAEVRRPHVVAAAVGVDAAEPAPLVAPVELRREGGVMGRGGAGSGPPARLSREPSVAARRLATQAGGRRALKTVATTHAGTSMQNWMIWHVVRYFFHHTWIPRVASWRGGGEELFGRTEVSPRVATTGLAFDAAAALR